MKKITSIAGIIVCILVISVNVMITTQNEGYSSNLMLSQLWAMAGDEDPISGGELGEVTITCGSTTGKCWITYCETDYNPLGIGRITVCPAFSGLTFEDCLAGVPCW